MVTLRYASARIGIVRIVSHGVEFLQFLLEHGAPLDPRVPLGFLLLRHRAFHANLAGSHVDDDLVGVGQGLRTRDPELAAAFQLAIPFDLVGHGYIQPFVMKTLVLPFGGRKDVGKETLCA